MVLFGELGESFDLLAMGVDLIGLEEAFGSCGAGVGGDAVAIFRSEHALGERAERDAADAFLVEPVEDAGGFDCAVEDRVIPISPSY